MCNRGISFRWSGIVIFLMSMCLLSACSVADDGTVKDIDVETFSKFANENKGIVVDVRTDEEFAQGHIDGAKQFNFFDESFEANIVKLPKDKPLYVYCRSGNRSGKATKFLVSQGYTKVYNLVGGYMAWSKEMEQ